jgi:hypothetical protein
MKLTIEMELDNAAFTEGDLSEEIEYCLTRVMAKIAHGRMNGGIMDSNGNRVGEFDVE